MRMVRRHIAKTSTTNRSAVTNGSKLLVGIDGRCPSARRYRDLIKAYEGEVGGNLTEVERGLIKQAAALTLRAEGMQADIVNGVDVNNDVLIRISNTAKRILGVILTKATNRKPPAPTLQDHIARRHAAVGK